MLWTVTPFHVISYHVMSSWRFYINQFYSDNSGDTWYMIFHQLPPVAIQRYHIVLDIPMRGRISFVTNWDAANYMPVQNLSAVSALITFNQSVPCWMRNISFSVCCVLLFQWAGLTVHKGHTVQWASCQIRKIAHALGMPGTCSPPPRVSVPHMHHDTCVRRTRRDACRVR